jgi:sugar lactone lactonase YvrE
VAAFMTGLAACGGGGAPPEPEVVRITVSGMPTASMAPMQTAQLAASATYSDGAVKDVTGDAVWDSTDPEVIDVSPMGVATATGPGKAAVSAVFASVHGSVSGEVVALPAAYVIDGLDYAFDYRLDARGRVASYRISKRDGVSYPDAPGGDPNLRECTGSLQGSYACSGAYNYSMTGELGRLVAMRGPAPPSFFPYSFTYVYGQPGLVQFEQEMEFVSPHWWGSITGTLAYDERGGLSEVRTLCAFAHSYENRMEKTALVTVDSQGRLMHEDVATIYFPNPYVPGNVPCPADTVTWTYDAAGHMMTAGSTEYTADVDGWLTSRRRVFGAETRVDTYAITRFRGRVAEEQFTQAEPNAFYTARSDSQRVRYEWGRLPVEPLFVPRALTGLEGADYLGVISSHHRESGYVVPTPEPGLVVSTLAGAAGQAGSTDGAGAVARFNAPVGMAVDGAGNAWVVDVLNSAIRRITPAGVVSTVAGGAPGTADGQGAAARFALPNGITVDAAGNAYVADSGNHTIRKVTPDGVVSTLAGQAGTPGSTDGPLLEARFRQPMDVAIDGAGNLFVADAGNHTIRRISPNGVVSTLAGSPGLFGSTDGVGATARFSSPSGIATDPAGNVFVADLGTYIIRKIAPTGAVSTLAGAAGQPGAVDGWGAAARFNYPWAVCTDRFGNVYVADRANHAIRKISPDKLVITLAGAAGSSGAADGAAADARFNLPRGIASDAWGSIYVADSGNHTIRKITSSSPAAKAAMER